jgi:hypothetical protein
MDLCSMIGHRLSGSRETKLGQFQAFSVNSRRLGERKTSGGYLLVIQGEKRPPDFDGKAEPFSGVSPSGTLKTVFHLELLSARASPQLREQDKLRTFVPSPLYWVGVIV